jgi:hypothetical protein
VRAASPVQRIQSLKRAIEETNLTLTLLRQLAELEKATPATDAERRALDQKEKDLPAGFAVARTPANDLKGYNRRPTDPARRQQQVRYQLNLKRRRRDRQQLLEDELAGLLQEPPSAGRDARVHHLAEQIEAMKGFVAVDHEYETARERLRLARLARDKLSADGKDTRENDEELERAQLAFRAIRIRRADLHVRERLLGWPEETPRAHAPGSFDDARLREFERQLAEGVLNDQRLAAIEQALDAMVPESPTWQERLRAIYQEQLNLLADWRAHLSAGRDTTRQPREDLQHLDRFLDEAREAELAREITLLEQELQLAEGRP